LTNGVLMLKGFHWPLAHDLPNLIAAGGFAGAAQLCLILATRSAPANQVAPAQYSQMVWAILIGGLFFAEFPDLPAIIGICLIGVSGLFTFWREQTRGRWWSRTVLQGDRV
jgi:drug/metabolite transporter (DMT)-like permease